MAVFYTPPSFTSHWHKHHQWMQQWMPAGGVTVTYTPDDLEPDFLKRNEALFAVKHGYGAWVWKPAVTLATLQASNSDLVMYCDVGSAISCSWSTIRAWFDADPARWCFVSSLPYVEKDWTRDIVIQTICWDTPQQRDAIRYSDQYPATAFVLRRTHPQSLQFLQRWLQHCQDRALLLGDWNFHRCDQSIFSVLLKHMGVQPAMPFNSFFCHRIFYS